ncbi:MAG: hypothetical protein J6252_04735 [Clostridia bacterium]|nr:hypothetical protein [Clostridia bacterium]
MKMIKSFLAANCIACCSAAMLAGFAAGFFAGKAVYEKCGTVKTIAGKAKKAFREIENNLTA